MTFWTDEKVAELRRLAPGHTASQIAAIIGAPTRNIVIGKIYRLKLALNPDRPRGQARPKIAIKPRLTAPADRPVKLPPPMPCQPIPELACEPIPTLAVGIADLTQDACRWPLWGETTPSSERLYCGGKAVEGLPYCDTHCRLAFVKPNNTHAGWRAVEKTLPMRRAG